MSLPTGQVWRGANVKPCWQGSANGWWWGSSESFAQSCSSTYCIPPISSPKCTKIRYASRVRSFLSSVQPFDCIWLNLPQPTESNEIKRQSSVSIMPSLAFLPVKPILGNPLAQQRKPTTQVDFWRRRLKRWQLLNRLPKGVANGNDVCHNCRAMQQSQFHLAFISWMEPKLAFHPLVRHWLFHIKQYLGRRVLAPLQPRWRLRLPIAWRFVSLCYSHSWIGGNHSFILLVSQLRSLWCLLQSYWNQWELSKCFIDVFAYWKEAEVTSLSHQLSVPLDPVCGVLGQNLALGCLGGALNQNIRTLCFAYKFPISI